MVLRSSKHEVQVRCRLHYNTMAQLVAARNIYYTILQLKLYYYSLLVKDICINFSVLVAVRLFLLLHVVNGNNKFCFYWSSIASLIETNFQLSGCNKTIIAFSRQIISRNIKAFVLSPLVGWPLRRTVPRPQNKDPVWITRLESRRLVVQVPPRHTRRNNGTYCLFVGCSAKRERR